MTDPHIKIIREFVKFAYDVDKVKSVTNMYRMVAKPAELREDIAKSVKEEARRAFSEMDWDEPRGRLQYKTAYIDLKRLKNKCASSEGDYEDFQEYMDSFRILYQKENESIDNLLRELDLEVDSAEASFLKKIFNEIGGEFMDMVRSQDEGTEFEIASLLPKVANLVKDGKITDLMKNFSDSDIKMSKILFAIGKLLQKHEDKEEEENKDGEVSSSDEHSVIEDDA